MYTQKVIWAFFVSYPYRPVQYLALVLLIGNGNTWIRSSFEMCNMFMLSSAVCCACLYSSTSFLLVFTLTEGHSSHDRRSLITVIQKIAHCKEAIPRIYFGTMADVSGCNDNLSKYLDCYRSADWSYSLLWILSVTNLTNGVLVNLGQTFGVDSFWRQH